MKIGTVALDSPFVVAPMAGMTDTAFRRLVKRQGGCGLVVTEMVSSEGLVRGIDRTLEYAEYTEEERPVSIQIFGGDPAKMAAAAQIVEGIRQLVESELSYDPCPLVKEGEMVKVVSGPLKGVAGRLIRKGAHARLVLSVDLIGQAVSVEVDAADVRPY